MKRKATLSIERGIDLPMLPPIVAVGRGTNGKAVCQLHITATGVEFAGPKGGQICNLYWEQVVELAQMWPK
jgi:hypothetical protein